MLNMWSGIFLRGRLYSKFQLLSFTWRPLGSRNLYATIIIRVFGIFFSTEIDISVNLFRDLQKFTFLLLQV